MEAETVTVEPSPSPTSHLFICHRFIRDLRGLMIGGSISVLAVGLLAIVLFTWFPAAPSPEHIPSSQSPCAPLDSRCSRGLRGHTIAFQVNGEPDAPAPVADP